MAASAQCTECCPRADRKGAGDDRARLAKCRSIAARRRHDPEHAVASGVTHLERNSAHLRLNIRDDRVKLGWHPPRRIIHKPRDHAVPRSLIAERNRNLQLHAQGCVKPVAERPHELQLTGVAGGHGPRICADSHVEADNRANPCQLRNGCGGVDSSLDPSHMRARQADGSGDFGRGQTAGDAGASEFRADGAQVMSSESRSSVDSPFSGRHAIERDRTRSLGAQRHLLHPTAVTTNERTGRWPPGYFVVGLEHGMHFLTIERLREPAAARFVVRYGHPMHALRAGALPLG